jgi:hypothetical protein
MSFPNNPDTHPKWEEAQLGRYDEYSFGSVE